MKYAAVILVAVLMASVASATTHHHKKRKPKPSATPTQKVERFQHLVQHVEPLEPRDLMWLQQ